MKLLQFIILSALFTMILNQCSGKTREDCQSQQSYKKTRNEDWRCCWTDYRYKKSRDDEWSEKGYCESTPYDGDVISLLIKDVEYNVKFNGGEIEHYSIDCSSKWIHSFFYLVLLVAFIL